MHKTGVWNKKDKGYTDKKIIDLARRHHLSNNIILDKGYKANVRNSIDKTIQSDYLQPLEIWLYKGDKLIFAEVNCYANGFPNLKWDFQSFPPAYSPINTGKYLDLATHTMLLNTDHIKADTGYIAIIFWSAFMGRQNKRFLKAIDKYLDNTGVRRFYFYSDNIYAGGSLNK